LIWIFINRLLEGIEHLRIAYIGVTGGYRRGSFNCGQATLSLVESEDVTGDSSEDETEDCKVDVARRKHAID
jgi:outer membrane protease